MAKNITPAPAHALAHLGKVSNQTVEKVDLIPWKEGRCLIRLDCSEFTSFCPVTEQPDFGTLVIEYEPAAHIVETKSLKLYLRRFRDAKQFNERLACQIAQELYAQLRPHRLTVRGCFAIRGGISVTCEKTIPTEART